jgi:PAS domain S-box-containing protein
MTDLSGYSFERLREDAEFIVSRGRRAGDAVLLVAPASEHPSPASIERMNHAYSLRNDLDPSWAARPVELVTYRGRPSLVIEDHGGEFLDKWIGGPLVVPDFLRLAIGIAKALGRFHAQGLIHRDIKPANVIVDMATGEAWLTGFGLTSRLPRHRQPPAPPEVIAGTLAYMAPEQTGRMNRSVDSRSDIYSFGVTLYEMLVGALPFVASDPMDWVHCHIARQAIPPCERLKEIPPPLSAIVMKLLAKTAEERYQTAAGVEADLRHCMTAWETLGHIDLFLPGAGEISNRLLIPEKLYGREKEIELLLTAFDRVVSRGVTELVLVSGYSGVGKSSLVNELHKALVPTRGLFASGKFDQYKRDIPYATLALAFQGLIQQILAQNDAELRLWRDALQEALGSYGQLLVNLIPEIGVIIGKQPPIPDLPPLDARNRFQRVMRRFIGVFAQSEHPLVLFLDDLQWLDPATLELLEYLVTEPEVRHLLLIGAYRDHEVGPSHPLVRTLETIGELSGRVHEIVVSPLQLDHVCRLTADALHCEQDRARPLAQLVQDKTGGNPFFTIQFITALAEEGLLTFDLQAAAWRWDVARIRAKGITDNVVDMLVKKLNRLPAATLWALKQLACLGNSTETTALSKVLGVHEDRIHTYLLEAVRTGLVLRTESGYAFLHDRVQEAAYALIPQSERPAVHLRTGRVLASQIASADLEDHIFEIVNHLNRAVALIRPSVERDELAELNLIAGKRAKAASAFASALTYFAAGGELLSQDGWERRHTLAFALALQQAECEYMTGALPSAKERLAMLFDRASSLPETAAVTCLSVDLHTNLDQAGRAVEVGLEYLRRAGIEWSPHPTDDAVGREYERIWQQLGSRSIEELIDLPPMTDPEARAALDVLTSVHAPANFVDGNLLSLMIGRMVNLSLQYGNGEGSSFAYVYVGMILGSRFGDYRAGFSFGKLGVDLLERGCLARFKARVLCNFGNAINSWVRHVRTSCDVLYRAVETAQEAGDSTFMAYSFTNLISALLGAGDHLGDVLRKAETGLALVQQARFGTGVDLILGQIGLIRALKGLTPSPTSFNHQEFDELAFERHLENDSGVAMASCWYWIRKLQAFFFAGDYNSAITSAAKARTLLWTSPAFFVICEYHFYSALAWAAQYDDAPPDQRPEYLEMLSAHHKQLEARAEDCPENFANRAALVAAEIARIEGRDADAMRLYEQAIRSAREHGFVQNEALAYEVAARFYAARGVEKIAHVYLRDARYCYVRWGADGKVRQLDELYPAVREVMLPPNLTNTMGASVEHLDLATVIKVSQAISSEIVPEKLIDVIMRAAIEHAGAERGLLILPRGDELRIEAEATTGDNTIVVRLREAAVTADEAPDSIVHYVVRTQENVILDDASSRNPFSSDPYFRQHRTRSVLCLPLLKQAKLIGILYLENNLAIHVFTPVRVAVLKLLASEAAISLENTRLYGELKEREARIRRLVEANIIGIFIWNVEGLLIEANEAFLQMVKYSHEDLVSGRIRWTDLTPPECRDRDERALAETRATGIAQPYEKQYIRKDGSRVSVLIGAAMFEGRAHEGVAFVVDLSELKSSEARKAAIMDSALDCIVTIDHDGCITEFNPSAEATFGYRREEVVGRLMADVLIPPSLREAHRRGLVRYLATGEERVLGRRIEMTAMRAGGSEFPIELAITRIPMDGPPSFTAYLRDITESKQAAEELRRSEAGLMKAQAELAHVTRVTTMGELAASIAHEVNQPIAGIVINANACLRWLAGVREESANLTEARATLQRIIRDGNRAGEIITRIRALFKKTGPAREPLDFNETIREIIILARTEMDTQRVALRLELAADLALVLGDKVQLQQVMLNLILNAIEAMATVEDRSRDLVIRTESRKAGIVLVTVRDSGPGLDSAGMEHIFAAFHTSKPGGLGMGLSISRSIVESHSGRLWATAHDGPGASFHFTLPTT